VIGIYLLHAYHITDLNTFLMIVHITDWNMFHDPIVNYDQAGWL